MFLSRKDVRELHPHHFIAEASTVGLLPGSWPQSIHTDLGNGRALLQAHVDLAADGELVSVFYRQHLGCINVRIFND